MRVAYLLLVLCGLNQSSSLHPVLLVPGDGGSIIMARYTKLPPHYICGFREKWFVLWLNLFYMTPLTLNCFTETVKLEYDRHSRTTFSPDFCITKVDGFGTSDAVEYFSCFKVKPTSYFYYVISSMVSELKYERNKSIRGTPFDFRKGPNELDGFVSDVIDLIEQMYRENSNRSVIIMAHSLGNVYVSRILNAKPQLWKDTYIKTFISISPPYGGAVAAVLTALSGNNENIDILSPISLRSAQSTWPSTYSLMPNPEMWSLDTLVSTKEGNYSAASLSKLLESSKLPYATDHLEDVLKVWKRPLAPNVSVHCIYSDDVLTPEYLDYRHGNFPQDQPVIFNGPGDGTVNLQSLKLCSNWKNEQTQPVTTQIVSNVKHLSIMRDQRLIDMVIEIIRKENMEH